MPFKFENKDQEIEFNNVTKGALGLLFEQDPDFAQYATTKAGVQDPQASQLAAGPEQPSLDPLARGFVDEQGNTTEKGQLAYNLKEAGLLDDNLKLTQKGLAFSLSDDEVFDGDRVDLFKIREESGIGKTPGEGPTFGQMVSAAKDLVWDAATFLGVQSSNEVKGLWNETDKTAAAVGQIALAEGTIANAKRFGEVTKVGLAKYAQVVSGTPAFGGAPGVSVPASMMAEYVPSSEATPTSEKTKVADNYYWSSRFERAKNDHYLENAKDGQILDDYASFDSAVEVMANAKEELGTKRYNAIVKKGKASSDILTDPANAIPLQFAVKAARMIPLMSRAMAYASKRMDNLALMLRNQAAIKEGAGVATATIARNQDQLDTVNRIVESLDKRVEIDPSLQPRLDKAKALQSTITSRIDKLNGSLGELETTGSRLANQIAATQASLPTKASETLLRLAERAREIKRLPFNAVAGTTERIGKGLVKLDDGLSSIAERFGLDKAYELLRSGLGQTGLYGAGTLIGPAGPMIGAGFTVLRSGQSLQNFGKFTRSIGKEVAQARGQIPFWQRVANHSEISPAHKATAHLLDMATLGGAIPGAIRRTSRGVVASYPVDLAFEYLYSEPGEDFTEISKRAAAESLVIGGSAAALGGVLLGSNTRHKQLAVGDEMNLRRDLSPENRALFNTLNPDLRRSIATYSAINPALKFKFTTSGNSFYDQSSQIVAVNINSSNPLKPLLAHEVMHHVVDRNQMEGGIAAMLVGDGERGGILRDSEGNLNPEFQSFMDAYNKRMVDSGLKPISQDVAAVEFYIEQSVDRVAAMAESGELGRISSKTNVRRALDSVIDATLSRLPIISNLHFALGGKMDQAGRPVQGSGLFSKAMQEIPAIRNMTRDMLKRSGGRAFGGFEPLGVEAGDLGVKIPVQKGDRAVLDGLISIFETQEVDGKTVPVYDKNGDPVMLNQATDAARAKAGLKIAEIYENLGRERKPGELFMAEDGTWTGTFIGDDVIKQLADSGIFNKEQIRILRNLNSATRNFTGARFTVVNHPATKRVGKKVRYATLAPTLRDVVPVSITISKDGNILVGLMSVTKLQENIVNLAKSKRGRSLYDGNTEQIRTDVGAVMELHRQNQTTDQYFNDKYGITKGKEYKNFINTVFGLVGGKAQKDLNPLFDADKIKEQDQVYRTYRLDRISQATRMTGETAVNMPFVYDAVKLNLFPNGLPTLDEQGNPVAGRRLTPEATAPIEAEEPARLMPERMDISPEDLNPVENRQEAQGLWADGKRMFAINEMDEKLTPITSKAMLDSYPVDAIGWMESDAEPTGQARFLPEKLDADYMRAVEGGDMQTAQRLVGEIASRKAGKDNIVLYRGLENEQDPSYDRSRRDSPQGYSTWTDNIMLARQYAGENGFVYTTFVPRDEVKREYIDKDGERAFVYPTGKKAGINNVSGKEYLLYEDHDLFDPSQIESADPITRDSNGNVIPPSKRFDIASKDVRFMPEKYKSHHDETLLNSAWNGKELDLPRPFKANESLPSLAMRTKWEKKPLVNKDNFDFTQKARVAFGKNKNGEDVTIKFDPNLLNKPNIVDFADVYTGEQIQYTIADRMSAVDGDMGGALHPFLKNNDVTIEGPDGRKYVVAWGNNSATVGTKMRRKAKDGAKVLMVYLMGKDAHESNTRTVRLFDTQLENSSMPSYMADIARAFAYIPIKAIKHKSALKQIERIDGLLKKAKTAKKGLDYINKLKSDKNLAIKEAKKFKASEYESELAGIFRKLKTSQTRLNNGIGKQSTVDANIKELIEFATSAKGEKLIGEMPSKFIYGMTKTFDGRKAAVSQISNLQLYDFDGPALSAATADMDTGDKNAIVTAIDLSDNQDFFMLYMGDDPKQISAMTESEKVAANKLKQNSDFVIHEAYDTLILSPLEGRRNLNSRMENALDAVPDSFQAVLDDRPSVKAQVGKKDAKGRMILSEDNLLNTVRDQQTVPLIYNPRK